MDPFWDFCEASDLTIGIAISLAATLRRKLRWCQMIEVIPTQFLDLDYRPSAVLRNEKKTRRKLRLVTPAIGPGTASFLAARLEFSFLRPGSLCLRQLRRRRLGSSAQ